MIKRTSSTGDSLNQVNTGRGWGGDDAPGSFDAETPELLAGEIEVDESYLVGVEEQRATIQEIVRPTTTFSTEAKGVLDSISEKTQSSDLSTAKSIAMLWSAEYLFGTINGFSP